MTHFTRLLGARSQISTRGIAKHTNPHKNYSKCHMGALKANVCLIYAIVYPTKHVDPFIFMMVLGGHPSGFEWHWSGSHDSHSGWTFH